MRHTLLVPDPTSPEAREPDGGDLAAGPFSSWVRDLQHAVRGERDADVPCGTCTACCTSSQFVHIGPDEHETLARIPAALLFPAPRLPSGHVLLGYDERGHCPMLIDHMCSIYEDRPKACRTYDCRVFAAAGLDVTEDDKVDIARRVRRWRFSYAGPSDRRRHDAVRSAAGFLASHPELLPPGIAATNQTQLAVLALEVHDLFLASGVPGDPATPASPDLDAMRDRLRRWAAAGRPAPR
jgi:uncharacterized protein